MDIFISNLPSAYSSIRLNIFLREELRTFDILAYDIYKQTKLNWAILTVANAVNGQRFVNYFGIYGPQQLQLGVRAIGVKKSNKGVPTKSKIEALLYKEQRMRSKSSRDPSAVKQGQRCSSFPIKTLKIGVWTQDREGRHEFDGKVTDERVGSIIFGKNTLVLYRERGTHQDLALHTRIDVHYGIVEHAILIDDSPLPAMIFTLRAPPKIYEIVDTDDIGLYTTQDVTATQVSSEDQLSDMLRLQLAQGTKTQGVQHLKRLCSLERRHPLSASLCMVYKVSLANMKAFEDAIRLMKGLRKFTLYHQKIMFSSVRTQNMEVDYDTFQLNLNVMRLPFGISFQLSKLVLEGTLTPVKAQDVLLWATVALTAQGAHGSDSVSEAINQLGQQVPTPTPYNASNHSPTALRSFLDERLRAVEQTSTRIDFHNDQRQHLVRTFKATVTPTGIFLRGPEWNIANRVLRKYVSYSEYFMRVTFADEDGQPVSYDSRANQDDVYSRFRSVLLGGITIAGRHFEFLGWSHSSLREHQAWMMAGFSRDGTWMLAEDIRMELGDFSNIRCAAKCAARIGQAFSDTMFAIPIPENVYVTENYADVNRNGRCFSDGCGTISFDLLKMIWSQLPARRRKRHPTILQIRYRGAKGVVSLDTRLTGLQLRIRGSMTKFTAKSIWNDLEICGANYRPGRLYLNHQSIKILEDAAIPVEKFQQLQSDGLRRLKTAFQHPISAAALLESSQTGVHARVPALIEMLNHIGLSFLKDPFLIEVVKIAAMTTLRDLKYRGRIEVTKGKLLYGIMDETNTLLEGQVFVTFEEQDRNGNWERSIIEQDRIVVTRAPALHPGDVQVVQAVNVPDSCALRKLRNCIVFSQKGSRDVPSMLSGGDLDGDEYGVIYDDRLIPPPFCTASPADYPPVQPFDLGRPVVAKDMIRFFTDFMQQDRLGQISIKHKIRADFREEGTLHPDCIVLAELGSQAVDFTKSGVPADMSKVSRGTDHLRPDFMNTQNGIVLNELGTLEIQELELDDIDEPDHLQAIDPDRKPYRFYPSKKANGVLFRDVNEHMFFQQINEIRHSNSEGSNVINQLNAYIDREAMSVQWEHHRGFAENTREYYIANLRDIQHSLRLHRNDDLTELEVITGNVLGMKARASNRYTRNAGQEVRERFNYDISVIMKMITNGEEGWDAQRDGDEVLPRAIACWKVALEGEDRDVRSAKALERQGRSLRVDQKPVLSWKYVCAAVLLDELMRFKSALLRRL